MTENTNTQSNIVSSTAASPLHMETLTQLQAKSRTTAAANIAARFLLSRFPPASSGAERDPAAAFAELYNDVFKYVVYALLRPMGGLPDAALFGALYLLQKRAEIKPAPTEGPHALFITAYMLAGHALSDGSYALAHWRNIGRDMFSLEQMMKFERGFCSALDWRLSIHAEPLEEFVSTLSGELVQLIASGNRATDSIRAQVDILEDFKDAISEELSQPRHRVAGSVTVP